jgi:hypothetical protein
VDVGPRAAKRLGRLGQGVFFEVGENDLHVRRCKALGHSTADAAGGTRDHRNLARYVSHVGSLPERLAAATGRAALAQAITFGAPIV